MKSFSLFLALFLGIPASQAAEKIVLRVGYFPNITHAQGIIGSHSTRLMAGHSTRLMAGQSTTSAAGRATGSAAGQSSQAQRGWFEQRLGPDVTIQWFAYNAGPSAMEAMFAGSIDLTYVGPNPALNAYIRSKGDEIRILAGAAEGGAALVVAGSGGIAKPADFKGKKLATPQLGNTQDVAARAWLAKQGLKVTLTGGDVSVIPTANADQLALFQQKKLDAVWTVEPWVARLELEADGKVLVDQGDALTTILVSSTKFLKAQPALAEKFVAAHRELTAWINANSSEAQEQVRAGLTAEIKREMSKTIVTTAWRRLRFTDQVAQKQFDALVADAQSVGFLRDSIPLDRLFSGKP